MADRNVGGNLEIMLSGSPFEQGMTEEDFYQIIPENNTEMPYDDKTGRLNVFAIGRLTAAIQISYIISEYLKSIRS